MMNLDILQAAADLASPAIAAKDLKPQVLGNAVLQI
jgi:hypothetical protein